MTEFIVLLVAGVLLLVASRRAYLHWREREARWPRIQKDLEDCRRELNDEKSRAYEERERANRAEKEARTWRRKAATLYGGPGEPIADAAARLGIEIRHKGKDIWLGRRGNDGYWVRNPPEPAGPSKALQPAFYKIDDEEDPFAQAKRFFDLDEEALRRGIYALADGGEFQGWKLIERGTRDLAYTQQRYDGDFAAYWLVADPIGRRVDIDDHLGSSFTREWEW